MHRQIENNMNKGFLTDTEGLTDFTTDITISSVYEEELIAGLEKTMLKII